jgi:hypothetical protein
MRRHLVTLHLDGYRPDLVIEASDQQEVRKRLNLDFSAGEVRTYDNFGGGEVLIRWSNVRRGN